MSNKISIKQLILEYLNSKDEGSDRFRRLYRIASLQGVRKFAMDITGEFLTVLLPISANGTVAYPEDYLDWSMLGIVNSEGEAVPLRYNEDLVTIKQGYVNGLTIPVPQQSDIFSSPDGFPFLWANYCNDGSFMHLYGIGGGSPSPGAFQINDEMQCFMIQPGFPYSSILVEYLSNGCDCGDYKIPVFASDAFIAWLRWKDNIDKKGVSDGKIKSLKSEFALEKTAAKARINKARITSMEQVFRHHIKLVARA